jgi:cytochrome oxidase Cu insertion factor (SCO1/SenC/PrrC family)
MTLFKLSFTITIFSLVLAGLFVTACSALAPTTTIDPITAESVAATETAASEWDWFSVELTDAQTGQTFTMNDYAGKVVLVETMAIWCPNCIVQANEVRDLHKLLGNPEDLVSVSLDVDLNEDQASLKEYVEEFDFEWRFAVAPLEVARALGNLYSAQYLNPPLNPMLIIDRNGDVHTLDYGKKSAETLQKSVEPYLTQ